MQEYPDIPQECAGDAILVLGPNWRLRNEHSHVLLYGEEVGLTRPVHLSSADGMILALFNRKRTVDDVVRLAVPLLSDPRSEGAYSEASCQVRELIQRMCELSQMTAGAFGDSERRRKGVLVTPAVAAESGLPLPVYEMSEFSPPKGSSSVPEKKRVKSRTPYYLDWQLNDQCNADCQYCFLSGNRRRHLRLLPRTRMLEIIQEARRLHVLRIAPSGIDVLLYPGLLEFLEALTLHAFLPVLLSTKSYVSPDMARNLAKFKIVSKFQISLDSTVEEIADFLVRKQGYCAEALRSIDNAVSAGLPVVVRTVITPYNLVTLPRLYRDLRRRGVVSVRFAPYNRALDRHRDALFNHLEDFDWLDQEFSKLREEFHDSEIGCIGRRPLPCRPSPSEQEERWKFKRGCAAGRRLMHICPDGKVKPCRRYPDTEEGFCGDLSTQSIEEVWNSDRLAELTTKMPRQKFDNTVCSRCPDIDRCHSEIGYCAGNAYQRYGTLYEVDPECPRAEHWVRPV